MNILKQITGLNFTTVIDLSKCSKGDILISKHGTRLKYLEPLPKGNYYDHLVEYCDKIKGNGTRTNDGFVFRKNRQPDDEDIILIITKNK